MEEQLELTKNDIIVLKSAYKLAYSHYITWSTVAYGRASVSQSSDSKFKTYCCLFDNLV